MGYGAKLTSKGQTTVPIEIRKFLDLTPGDHIDFVIENGEVKLKAKTRSIMEFAGILGSPSTGSDKPIGEVDDVIAQSLADDDRRIMRDWNRHQRAAKISDDRRSGPTRKSS
ncbi:AbrB/MazE/SpoVT family DNA-binding domain-containing protein [Agrobacterium sp. a22-2]|uniref:AbrB/MazE/SpoVT family DNA-binding domain-containing protein n=1 Tax=Agrobacterium sp. a22-2 TaxID=2283840 RepID=UPI00144788BC|nr:AbrB/MazE/SpoVT family DNA-binding domain-containing protein [Agrobacterium sp. a22-2]NKN35581.1 AbrB/MazE/SpoVT family DNA-binding domain-containing protein [Agrobacterium sp. a22-2]